MDLGIAGRRALVCASSSGLGLACAAALAREGCEVCMRTWVRWFAEMCCGKRANCVPHSARRRNGSGVCDRFEPAKRGRECAWHGACLDPHSACVFRLRVCEAASRLPLPRRMPQLLGVWS